MLNFTVVSQIFTHRHRACVNTQIISIGMSLNRHICVWYIAVCCSVIQLNYAFQMSLSCHHTLSNVFSLHSKLSMSNHKPETWAMKESFKCIAPTLLDVFEGGTKHITHSLSPPVSSWCSRLNLLVISPFRNQSSVWRHTHLYYLIEWTGICGRMHD